MPKEAPKSTCDRTEKLPLETSKKFTDLKKDILENIDLIKGADLPVVELGKDKNPVPPYSQMEKMLTPEEYFKYIAELIDSPEDIRLVINEPFMHWQEDKPEDKDKIKLAHIIVAENGGDCDNLSWVAKKLLDHLGCKKGFNYQAKVIGINDHAVCTFVDTDGQKKCINQGAAIIPFSDIRQASKIFDKSPESDVREIMLNDKGTADYAISVNPKTLEDNSEYFAASIYAPYSKTETKLDDFLPKTWQDYSTSEILFNNDIVQFFKKGKLVQMDNTKAHTVDYYDLNTGSLDYRKHSEGQVLREFFNPSGKVIQKDYRSKESSPYEVEWFDEDGVLIQRKDWDGKIENMEDR